CLEVRLGANCRERDVFLIQPLVPPVQEHLVELLLMIDAARGASAARITAVMPHYAYARSDKKDAPRISLGGRLVADLIATAGADRVLTMTLHSPQVHGFFSVPVDHLHASVSWLTTSSSSICRTWSWFLRISETPRRCPPSLAGSAFPWRPARSSASTTTGSASPPSLGTSPDAT